MNDKKKSVFNHVNGNAWLNSSTLTREQREDLLNKYNGADFSTLDIVNKLTPEEALYSPLSFVKAICTTIQEIENPCEIKQLTAHELLTAFYRELAAESGGGPQTLAYALVTAARGTPTEKKHAKSMPRRKFSHHTYGAAVDKLIDQAAIYIDCLELEVPKALLSLKELALFRAENKSLIHGDYISSNSMYDAGAKYDINSLPLIKDLQSAKELCSELSSLKPNQHFFVVKVRGPGDLNFFVCRNAESYHFRNFLVVKASNGQWTVYPKIPGQGCNVDVSLKPVQFATIEEVFNFSKHTSYDEFKDSNNKAEQECNDIASPMTPAEVVLNEQEEEASLFGADLQTLIDEDITDRERQMVLVLNKVREMESDFKEVASQVKKDGDLTRLTEEMREFFPATVEALYRAYYNPPIKVKEQPVISTRRIVSFESGYPEVRAA